MAKENEKTKKPVTITDVYKILQELKHVVDELKETNANLKELVADIKRNREV